MIEIEIDGVTTQVEAGSTIIEVADKLGVKIPRFCYHKKLSIAASCRMCLVEVNNFPKPLPACATSVAQGMKVKTQSVMALSAQKSVMEFLLINHPLDCPICDQGGECELQDLAVGFGSDVSRFTEGKRVLEDKNIGPLIATDMTKCIHCTRCIRFGDEIAGERELGALNRGEFMHIDTYVEQHVASELSGNVIDLCPVGALTSKPFKYSARPWDLKQYRSISPHDCLGSNLLLHVYQNNQLKRVTAYENEQINEVWLSDRDRFAYLGVHAKDRLRTPLIRENNKWQPVSWEEAFDWLRVRLAKLLTEHTADELGALYSHSSTLEEIYLLQKLMRSLGCENIDGRLAQTDFSDEGMENSIGLPKCNIVQLALQEVIVVIGSNMRKEQPLLVTRLRQAVNNGAKVVVINPIDFNFNLGLEHKLIDNNLTCALSMVIKAILNQPQRPENSKLDENNIESLLWLLQDITANRSALDIADLLVKAKKITLVVGSLALTYPDAAQIKYLIRNLGNIVNASCLELTLGSNALGACIANALPRKGAIHASQMLTEGLAGYFLLNIEPEYDSYLGVAALKQLHAAKLVVAMTPYLSETMNYAHLVLPIGTFAETSGTFVNCDGTWQSFMGVIPPLYESRPAWKVLRVMANILQLPGFDYFASEDIVLEIKALVEHKHDMPLLDPFIPNQLYLEKYDGIWRVANVPLYAVDNIVRRSEGLQQTQDAKIAAVFVNEATMDKFGLKPKLDVVVRSGEDRVTLPLLLDNEVPDNTAYVPRGILATAALVGVSSNIELLQE